MLQSCFYIYTAHIPSRLNGGSEPGEGLSSKQQLLENMTVVENHVIVVK